MDNYQALQSFWEGFDLEAYDEQTVFTEDTMPSFPHITYESAGGGYMSTTVLYASIWDKSTSWGWLKQKSDEIRKAIGYGGQKVETDDGYLWIKLPENTEFSQPIDSGDDTVKRMRLNIEVDFMTF